MRDLETTLADGYRRRGLAVSTLAAYWLAASLFPKDDEVRAANTVGGLNRSRGVLREREKARFASVVLAIGFVLQYSVCC